MISCDTNQFLMFYLFGYSSSMSLIRLKANNNIWIFWFCMHIFIEPNEGLVSEGLVFYQTGIIIMW